MSSVGSGTSSSYSYSYSSSSICSACIICLSCCAVLIRYQPVAAGGGGAVIAFLYLRMLPVGVSDDATWSSASAHQLLLNPVSAGGGAVPCSSASFLLYFSDRESLISFLVIIRILDYCAIHLSPTIGSVHPSSFFTFTAFLPSFLASLILSSLSDIGLARLTVITTSFESGCLKPTLIP